MMIISALEFTGKGLGGIFRNNHINHHIAQLRRIKKQSGIYYDYYQSLKSSRVRARILNVIGSHNLIYPFKCFQLYRLW